jgi:hypothetical protein
LTSTINKIYWLRGLDDDDNCDYDTESKNEFTEDTFSDWHAYNKNVCLLQENNQH